MKLNMTLIIKDLLFNARVGIPKHSKGYIMKKEIGIGTYKGNKVKLYMEYVYHGTNSDFNIYYKWETTNLTGWEYESGEIKDMSLLEATHAGLTDEKLYDFISKYNGFGSLGQTHISNIAYYASETTVEKRIVWDKLIVKGIGIDAPVRIRYGGFEKRSDILEIDFYNPPKLVKVVDKGRYVGYTYEGSTHNERWNECPWESPSQYRKFCRIGREFGYVLIPMKRIKHNVKNTSYDLSLVCKNLILPMDTVLDKLSRIKDNNDSFVKDRLEYIGRNYILPFIKDNFDAETYNHAIVLSTKNYKKK